MSEGTKNFLKLFGVIVALIIAYKIAMMVFHFAISVAVPILIVGGIAYGVYRYSGGKPLMGGRKTLP
jgi:FtsH-binding integral membrane protein